MPCDHFSHRGRLNQQKRANHFFELTRPIRLISNGHELTVYIIIIMYLLFLQYHSLLFCSCQNTTYYLLLPLSQNLYTIQTISKTINSIFTSWPPQTKILPRHGMQLTPLPSPRQKPFPAKNCCNGSVRASRLGSTSCWSMYDVLISRFICPSLLRTP